ncbi:hypothetical protein PFISCL1PPCAC_28907 [Pristionchus fissidentatus]|uniref:UBC core domain-containing protein n=1 Tax=Pristionchus fissidentatus TaxID=1538716 RepID=A0AAV5X1G5_9BILA|nr:hypothetical protein PFISCL1PPCAC_12310 [Pristionchus fissidentatus]GMT37610.1 hypothetical protein PFISCL1PPCAC_28907 [Pristionchus fissidentatus]
MSNLSVRRIQRECREVVTDGAFSDLGITIEVLDDAAFSHLKAEIRGPPDTPYENGRFILDIVFPNDYPFKALSAKFVTKVWHPNVSSQTGTICLDILKDKWSVASASFSLRTVLLSIQTLLSSPEPSDPQDAVVAKQYMSERPEFDRTARFWTQHFAGGPGEKDKDMVARINNVTLEIHNETEAISVLSCNNWDVVKAITYVKS